MQDKRRRSRGAAVALVLLAVALAALGGASRNERKAAGRRRARHVCRQLGRGLRRRHTRPQA